jgi:opacity protein-like surface antigen
MKIWTKKVLYTINILFLVFVLAGTATASSSSNSDLEVTTTHTSQDTSLLKNSKTINSTITTTKAKASKGNIVYNEPYWWDQKQHGLHSCGPTSGAMALSALGVIVDHEHMTIHYHTTLTNTKPSAIIQGSIEHASEEGIRLTGWLEEFSTWQRLGELIANPKRAVVLHGSTSGWDKYYNSSIGHYVFPVKIDLTQRKIWIADPDRSGTLEYTFDEFKPGLDAISQPNLIVLKRITKGPLPAPSVYRKLNDPIPPIVQSYIPTNYQTSYSTTSGINIKFSEKIKADIAYRYIVVKNQLNQKLNMIISITGDTINIKTVTRTNNTWYRVVIPRKAVQDLAGNYLTETYTFLFKTGG